MKQSKPKHQARQRSSGLILAPPQRCERTTTHPTPMAPIIVTHADPSRPAHFQRMASQLQSYLAAASIPYISIEHVGSTSVPKLAAKPNIDIVILVADAITADQARIALTWQPPPTEYYKCVGNGGIRGRISMKFQDRLHMPERSVYIICEKDEEGMLGLRGYRDLKKILCADTQEAEDLRREYEYVKWEMVQEGIENGIEYGRRKNSIIGKILKRAGWTDEEVQKKEALDAREIQEDWEL